MEIDIWAFYCSDRGCEGLNGRNARGAFDSGVSGGCQGGQSFRHH